MIAALTFATYAVTLNGEPVLPRTRAAVLMGRVWLPVRAVGAAAGARVDYDARTHVVTVTRGSHSARVAVHVAGTGLRAGALVAGGRTYLPLRIIGTALGLSVGYDAYTRTVALRDRAVDSALREGVPRTGATSSSSATTVAAGPPPAPTISVQPQPGATVNDPYPAVSARFAGVASIDPASLHVVVDGRDVSSEAAVVGDEVLWTPRRALATGAHTIAVTARDASGEPLAQQWSFDDTFAFAPPPPPAPFPVAAIWIDRWITPGTKAFDVYVNGVPGMSGYVGVDGVGGFFPLQVYAANGYVAHVVIPPGVNQPYARIAARLTFPNGDMQTLVLPQRFTIITPLGSAYPTPAPAPPRRLPRVPLSGATPGSTRVPLSGATPSPHATPSARATLMPRATPTPRVTATPVATPSPRPSPALVPLRERPTPLPRRTLPPRPTPSPPPG